MAIGGQRSQFSVLSKEDDGVISHESRDMHAQGPLNDISNSAEKRNKITKNKETISVKIMGRENEQPKKINNGLKIVDVGSRVENLKKMELGEGSNKGAMETWLGAKTRLGLGSSSEVSLHLDRAVYVHSKSTTYEKRSNLNDSIGISKPSTSAPNEERTELGVQGTKDKVAAAVFEADIPLDPGAQNEGSYLVRSNPLSHVLNDEDMDEVETTAIIGQ